MCLLTNNARIRTAVGVHDIYGNIKIASALTGLEIQPDIYWVASNRADSLCMILKFLEILCRLSILPLSGKGDSKD